MENQELTTALHELEGNIQQLVAEIHTLRDENISLQNKIKQQEEALKDFQNQSKITKLVKGISLAELDADKLKERIDENILIIDKCIARLGDLEDRYNAEQA